MNDILQNLNVTDRRRIEAVAQELSRYGLGILAPHTHDRDGKIGPLPSDMVSYEKNLKVGFVPQASVPSNSIAVGWRWNNGALSACAHCCAH